MTGSASGFTPRWASPPGETIEDALHELGLAHDEFAESIGLPHGKLSGLLLGSETISIDLARKISTSIGGSVEFWLTRDGQYHDDLSRLEADEWANSLPVSQMSSLGWIARPRDWQEQITSCLEFFDVSDLSEWQRRYGSVVDQARFRSSDRNEIDARTTAAWLRRAELEASSLSCADWDPAGFDRTLAEIKRLTRVTDPQLFIPTLVASCAAVGVAVIVLRSPKRFPVSGAARYLSPDRPQIVLSARYLSDDHFWFTFFHEAGHVLLHDSRDVYIDQIDSQGREPASDAEQEADRFAMTRLVPDEVRNRLLRRNPSPMHIHELAIEAGVSPGILVGQLQYAGMIGYGSRLNRLKRRYRWDGPNLEKA